MGMVKYGTETPIVETETERQKILFVNLCSIFNMVTYSIESPMVNIKTER